MLLWDWKAYFTIVFVPIIALLPDYIWNTFWWLIRPTETQKLLLNTKVMSGNALMKAEEKRSDA